MQKVLMCPPDFFEVEYIINPWMKPESVDRARAMSQWQDLVVTYLRSGVFVEIIEPKKEVPDMVFATDQGISYEKGILLSNFRYAERQPETKYYQKWFADHNYPLQQIPKKYTLEGGECLSWGDYLLVGTGFRSHPEAPKILQKYLQQTVVGLELVDPMFYHLDTCLFPLNDQVVFYYPKAFSARAIKQLKKLVPDLQEFTEEEVFGFAANSVVVGRTVVMQKNNPTFAERVRAYGYTVKELDVSEFIKSGGGIHCLTFVLN